MKTVTSITTWTDAVGGRMSITYSEIDENTGKITSDNKRIDRVITDSDIKKDVSALEEYAQTFVDALE